MGFIEQFKGSIIDWTFYREVAFQKTSKTIKYLLVLFSILFIITGIKSAIGLNSDLQQFISDFKKKVPDFKLADGEFRFNAKQPYYLEGENNSVLVVDTTGATREDVLDKYSDGVFITKTKIYLKQQYQVRQINLKDYKEITLTKDKVLAFLPSLKWLIIIIGIVGYIVSLVGKLLSGVFLAMIGMFVNNAQKGPLQFGQAWNVGIYALTLPLLLEALVKLVYPQFPYFFLIYYAIAIFYVVKAVHWIINDTEIKVE
ncbi:hypothetical protein Tfer_2828 [Thermincola ferriacetica]|uniref:DUF1189 domain-containing protein n=1 Tax=Thermincola ferriacetica TaxID=281456 RepID=A0A0L6VZD7_9FIRM|nr:DUF1189 domain-containing protein [Thermincola ferriacetica]KNZ68576.1 hypothetical protein Tfer_2828 [Thermincola ferriacetica]